MCNIRNINSDKMVQFSSISTFVVLFIAFSVRGFLLNTNNSNHLLSSGQTTGYNANTIIYLFKKIDDLQLQIHQQSKTLEVLNKTMEAQSKTIEAQNKTMEAQSKTLEVQSKTMETQNKTLEAQNKTMEAQSKTLEVQIKTLEAQNKTMETQTNVIQELLNITKQEPSAVSLSNDLSILQMFVRRMIDDYNKLCNGSNTTDVLALKINSMASSVRLITLSLTTQENRMNKKEIEFQQQINSLNKSLSATINRLLQDENDIFSNYSYVSNILSRLETNISDINDRIHSFEGKAIFDDVDCSDILRRNTNIKGQDGVYTIYPDRISNRTVYCDMTTEGGGWTVIQNRIDGSTDFYRTWKEYKEGFGNSSHNYWIGNDVIHLLTKDKTQVLRAEFQRFSGEKGYAEYSTFIVGDEHSKYNLTVAGHTGNIGDMLHYHNDMMFSTRDQDNDAGERMCANLYYGAWWYNDCYHSNPNGKYIGSNKSDATSMNWNWENVHESLQTTRLMIRSEPS